MKACAAPKQKRMHLVDLLTGDAQFRSEAASKERSSALSSTNPQLNCTGGNENRHDTGASTVNSNRRGHEKHYLIPTNQYIEKQRPIHKLLNPSFQP